MKLIHSAANRYGLLRGEDAPKLLDYATSPSSLPWFSRWRGRLGLSSDQVRAAYASRPAAEAENKLDEPRHALGDSVELVFKTFEGEERRVSGYEGESVMVRPLSFSRLAWDRHTETLCRRKLRAGTSCLRFWPHAAATANVQLVTS